MTPEPTSSPAQVPPLRWIVPALLLAVEWAVLSIFVELPTSGPALPIADALRLAFPVVLGAGAAAWLVSRARGVAEPALAAQTGEPSEWRPLPWGAVQLAAFGGTGLLAYRFMRAEGPSPGVAPFLLVLACAIATSVVALPLAGPPAALARAVRSSWRAPLLALVVGIACWRAAMAVEQLWGLLSTVTLHAAAGVLRLAGEHPVVDSAEALIGLGGFEVLVKPECSGADGVGLVVTFQLFWIALSRQRLRARRAVWLLPLGALAAMSANVLRIAGLILLGGAGYEDLALGGFHSKMGWALFLAIGLASVALAERWSWTRRPEPASPEPLPRHAVPALAGLAPFLVTLAASLLTGLWTAGVLDRAYAVRVVCALGALAMVRGALPSLRPSHALLPVALGLVVGAVWVGLAPAEAGRLAAELNGLGGLERGVWIAVRGAGAVLVVPVVEELAFRGSLFEWLSEGAGPRAEGGFPWPAVLLSSLAFGAVHSSFALGSLAGLAFGFVRAWRGRVGDAMVAHAVANAVVAAAALQGHWELWA